jgi:hypothetical protein
VISGARLPLCATCKVTLANVLKLSAQTVVRIRFDTARYDSIVFASELKAARSVRKFFSESG